MASSSVRDALGGAMTMASCPAAPAVFGPRPVPPQLALTENKSSEQTRTIELRLLRVSLESIDSIGCGF
jgi:hypothetical protein